METTRRLKRAEVHLLALDGQQYVAAAAPLATERFQTGRPFPLSFDPAVLLEP